MSVREASAGKKGVKMLVETPFGAPTKGNVPKSEAEHVQR